MGEFQHNNYVIVIEFVNTLSRIIKLFRKNFKNTLNKFVKKCERRPGGKSRHKVNKFITIETNNYRKVVMLFK